MEILGETTPITIGLAISMIPVVFWLAKLHSKTNEAMAVAVKEEKAVRATELAQRNELAIKDVLNIQHTLSEKLARIETAVAHLELGLKDLSDTVKENNKEVGDKVDRMIQILAKRYE